MKIGRVKERAKSLKNRANRTKLLAYIDEERHRVEVSTINSRMDALMALGEHLGRRTWRMARRDDIIQVIANHISRQGAHLRRNGTAGSKPLGDSTKFQWAVFLQGYYRWLLNLDKGEKPSQFRRLPFRKVEAMSQRIKVMVLTPAEVRGLLAGAKTKRDKAIVIVALEGGFRASEEAALRLDGLAKRNHGFWLTLDETEPDLKTGARDVDVPIIAGQQILAEWLEEHPLRHQKRAPLFVTQSNRSQGKRMTGASIGAVIVRCAKRGGIRRITHHYLRHSSVSFKVVRKMAPEAIRVLHGWTKKSTMLGYYTAALPFYESMVLEVHGLRSEEHVEILDILGSVPCLLCGSKVDVTKQECTGCGIPNSDAIASGQQRRNEDGAVAYVAVELALSLGWQANGDGARLEGAVEFLRQRHGSSEDFVRWCLREWARRCGEK